MKANNQFNNVVLENYFKNTLYKEILNSLPKSNNFSMLLETLLNSMASSQDDDLKTELNNNMAGINLENLPMIKNMEDTITFKNINSTNLNKINNSYGINSYKDISKPYSNGKIIVKNPAILKAVEKASQKYGMDKNLILSVIKQESDFNPKCVSHAGAMGLMQLMPENCVEYGVSNPYSIEENIDAGTRHLKDMIKLQKGNLMLGLASYNAGPGTLRRRAVTTVEGISKLPSETRHYVKKVMNYYKG
ncbi:lytic transglycosylase domain-containing protein [Hathewaya histolytica]|uniref:lytic transglycosylase domain-containing protein n=1 Tax=Hathewaya histolytica TaxID=1498 RepID=UPI003B6709EA